MSRRLYEGDHRNVAQSLNNFASCLRALGEHDQGRELHEEALAMRRRLYEGDHPDVAQSLNNLAICLRALGSMTGRESWTRRPWRCSTGWRNDD